MRFSAYLWFVLTAQMARCPSAEAPVTHLTGGAVWVVVTDDCIFVKITAQL